MSKKNKKPLNSSSYVASITISGVHGLRLASELEAAKNTASLAIRTYSAKLLDWMEKENTSGQLSQTSSVMSNGSVADAPSLSLKQ